MAIIIKGNVQGDVISDGGVKNETHYHYSGNNSEVGQANPVVDAIKELTGVVKESLKTPKQQFTVYPQSGSTANLGCQMQSPQFQVITSSTEQQPKVESNKRGDENV